MPKANTLTEYFTLLKSSQQPNIPQLEFQEEKVTPEKFVRIPVSLIRRGNDLDPEKDMIPSSRLLPLWFRINYNLRQYDNTSYVTVRELMDDYGYKVSTHKPAFWDSTFEDLFYLNNRGYIVVDLEKTTYKLSYDSKIEIQKVRIPIESFMKFHMSEYQKLISLKSYVTLDCLMAVYCSVMYTINLSNTLDSDLAAVCYKSGNSLARETGLCRHTVYKALDILSTSQNIDPLFKEKTCNLINGNKVPNEYAVNNDTADYNLEKGKKQMEDTIGISLTPESKRTIGFPHISNKEVSSTTEYATKIDKHNLESSYDRQQREKQEKRNNILENIQRHANERTQQSNDIQQITIQDIKEDPLHYYN